MIHYKLTTTEDLYLSIGKNIRRIRKERNMTQEQIADAVGGDQNYISKIENGRARPGLSVYLKIANVFHISIDCLLVDIMETNFKGCQSTFSEQSLHQPEQELAQKLLDAIFQYLQEKE